MHCGETENDHCKSSRIVLARHRDKIALKKSSIRLCNQVADPLVGNHCTFCRTCRERHLRRSPCSVSSIHGMLGVVDVSTIITRIMRSLNVNDKQLEINPWLL